MGEEETIVPPKNARLCLGGSTRAFCTVGYGCDELPESRHFLSTQSLRFEKNVFVLAYEFCVQALFIEIYQIPINPVSSQL
jgi:hypothetical protein